MNQMTTYKPFSILWVDNYLRWHDSTSPETAETYTNALRSFAAWLAYRGISSPSREDVMEYRDYLGSKHYAIRFSPSEGWDYQYDGGGVQKEVTLSASTVKMYVKTVSRFFAWTSAEGIYPNVAEGVKVKKLDGSEFKRDNLTAEEVQMVEKAIDAHYTAKMDAVKDSRKKAVAECYARTKALWLLTVTAGLRTVEVSRATVKDFERRGEAFSLFVWGKGHAEADKKMPLAVEVGKAIAEYLSIRSVPASPDSHLFVSTSNRSKGKGLTRDGVGAEISACLEWAGIDSDRITPHSLRHTAGTTALDVTGNIYATQAYMRHKDPATTEMYTHLNMENQQRETATAVYNALHGGTTQDDDRTALHAIIDGLDSEAVKALLKIAKGMTH